MFKLSDEDEDKNFLESLPFEELEKDEHEDFSANNHVGTENIQIPGKKENEFTVKKAVKRKFPGPAGNLPPNMTQEVMSPEYVLLSPSSEGWNNREVMDLPASQGCIEEMFSSKQWKRLLSDLGSSASDVLAKFNLKSMLMRANKKRLPKGKIPLVLGYVEQVDFQGTDGSIVIRDPSGKMNGSIHQELIKDPSTALQVGWVLVLRQVSVISLMRNHYLNITSGNIVVVYCLDKDHKVITTSWPSSTHQSDPQVSTSSNKTNQPCWDKLIFESEKELSEWCVHNVSVAPKMMNQSLITAAAQRKSTTGGTPLTNTSKMLWQNEPSSKSSLFSTNTALKTPLRTNPHFRAPHDNGVPKVHNLTNPTSVSSPTQHPKDNQNTVNCAFSNGDDFFDDDSDILLSLCDTGVLDGLVQPGNPNINPRFSSDHRTFFASDSMSKCETLNRFIPHSDPYSSTQVSTQYGIVTPLILSTNSYVPDNDTPSATESQSENAFSIKLVSSMQLSSDNCKSESGELAMQQLDPIGNVMSAKENHHTSHSKPDSPSAINGTHVNSSLGRNVKVQLGREIHSSKENHVGMKNIFGQWNADLSDDLLLSQLSEDF